MSKNKSVASPMPGCPAWTVAVFKAVDVPEGTEVAPVQAQEPVAVKGFWDVYEAGSKKIYVTVFNSLEAESYRENGYTVVDQSAPVQPVSTQQEEWPDADQGYGRPLRQSNLKRQSVAVPDGGLREVVGKIIKAMESSAAPVNLSHALSEVAAQDGRIDFDADLMAELLTAYSAAPAAQGDAKEVFQHTGGKRYEKLGELKAKVGDTGWWNAVRYRSLEDGQEYVTDSDRWHHSFTAIAAKEK